jgi:hypothetical protein
VIWAGTKVTELGDVQNEPLLVVAAITRIDADVRAVGGITDIQALVLTNIPEYIRASANVGHRPLLE